MRRFLVPVVFGLVVLASLAPGQSQHAWADEAAADERGAANSEVPKAAGGAVDAKTPVGDTWRFRRHDGLWWYWLPSNKWVYWTENAWTAYEPASYQRFRGRVSNRSYAATPSQQGNWGPVRYDRYGNRQYPYSSRRSGLQQLGPVPAMGGVRSLPGWGGER